MASKSTAFRILLVGVCITLVAILFDFQLEHHSFTSTRDFEFLFLKRIFMPTLYFGLSLVLIGGVCWAWRQASSLVLSLSGAALIAFALLGYRFTPINIHGWTSSLIFVYAAMCLIGLLFLMLAVMRFCRSGFALLRSKMNT